MTFKDPKKLLRAVVDIVERTLDTIPYQSRCNDVNDETFNEKGINPTNSGGHDHGDELDDANKTTDLHQL